MEKGEGRPIIHWVSNHVPLVLGKFLVLKQHKLPAKRQQFNLVEAWCIPITPLCRKAIRSSIERYHLPTKMLHKDLCSDGGQIFTKNSKNEVNTRRSQMGFHIISLYIYKIIILTRYKQGNFLPKGGFGWTPWPYQSPHHHHHHAPTYVCKK